VFSRLWQGQCPTPKSGHSPWLHRQGRASGLGQSTLWGPRRDQGDETNFRSHLGATLSPAHISGGDNYKYQRAQNADSHDTSPSLPPSLVHSRSAQPPALLQLEASQASPDPDIHTLTHSLTRTLFPLWSGKEQITVLGSIWAKSELPSHTPPDSGPREPFPGSKRPGTEWLQAWC
jgi:hypothetical protein